MKIFFVHVRNFSNTGDMSSCPYQYFKQFFDKFECKFVDISDSQPYNGGEITSEDCAIIGGGGLDGYHDVWHKRINEIIEKSKISIGWGFGNNFNPNRKPQTTVKINYDAFTLLGTRDYKETHGRYVPCPSCLNDEFKQDHEKLRKYGVIIHKDSTVSNSEFPKDSDIICNSMFPSRRVIKFIAESEIIYANSYHICYWASLLKTPFNIFQYDSNDYRFVNSEFMLNDFNNSNFYERCVNMNMDFFEKTKTLLQ